MRKFTISCDDLTLAGCVQFLANNGVRVQGRTLAELAYLVLRAFVTNLNQEGSIPPLSDAKAKELIDGVIGKTASEKYGAALRSILEAESSDPDMAKLEEAIDYQVPEEEITLREAEDIPEKVDFSNPPWQEGQLVPWEELKKAAPKDIYIEQADDSGDLAFKKAVQIVYSNYSKNDWGTNKCFRAVASTYNIVLPYKEILS